MNSLLINSFYRSGATIVGRIIIAALFIGGTTARAQVTPQEETAAPSTTDNVQVSPDTSPDPVPASAAADNPEASAPLSSEPAAAPASAAAAASPTSPNPPILSQSSPPPKPRRPIGLLIAGAATLGGGYLFSVAVGLKWWSKEAELAPNEVCMNCDAGPKLFVPLVGPFWAIPEADGTDGKVVVAAMGAVQVVGLGLLIAGIIVYTSGGDQTQASEDKKFRAAFSPSGTQLSLRF